MGDTSSTVRKISIRGAAVQDLKDSQKGGKRRAVRRTGKIRKTQEGGDGVPGPSLASDQNYTAAAKLTQTLKGGGIDTLTGTAPQNPIAVKTPAMNAALAVGTAPRVPTAAPPISSSFGPQNGGKLQLLPAKKKKTSKLVLAPPAGHHAPKKVATPVTKTRKIRVQLAGLKKRMTKAKAISKDSRDKSITEIRSVLEEAHLIKPAKEGKTVPESVLRDIYKDYLQLRNRAL